MSESIESMQARLAAYDNQAHETAVSSALTSAIQASGVTLRPGAAEQVASLLKPEVHTATSGNQQALVGPNFRTLNDHVADRLRSDSFAHFRADGAPSTRPAGDPSGRPMSPQGVLAAALGGLNVPTRPGDPGYGTQAVPAGQSLSAAIVQGVAAQRAAQAARGGATVDMSQPMGLRSKI
jgi:hypothetical protein